MSRGRRCDTSEDRQRPAGEDSLHVGLSEMAALMGLYREAASDLRFPRLLGDFMERVEKGNGGVQAAAAGGAGNSVEPWRPGEVAEAK